jgi:hypothetical protein
MWFILGWLSACSSMTPHENFRMHMESKLGMNIDSPVEEAGINPARLISSATLPNGNLENGYEYRGSCKYFFEVEQQTYTIVRWRYEGMEQDCEIVP